MGVGWKDDQSHTMRFNKLISMIDISKDSPIEFNELGCGYGALAKYLGTQGIGVKLYRGYDISTDMLDVARKHLSDLTVELHHGSALDIEADFSIA